jgi:beta-N-acetylhexosaminidase
MLGSLHDAMCGQLIVVGLAGTSLAEPERRALGAGLRGGVVLFKRNVEAGLTNVPALVAQVRDAAPPDAPPLVAVDQEGGRVVRLGPPALALPAMRRLGDLDDDNLLGRVAEAHARELRALGFTMSFAPVADVHTRPANPIIGDRAFASTPERVARLAGAWADGLRRGGVLSCAKHFPGHGDTSLDSHLALPHVERPRAELERTELAPFAELASRVDAMMTAHVIYEAIDPARPATLSPAIGTELLRRTLGFRGVLISDDLEMKAIAHGIGEAAVLAVAAGCDMVLVCSQPDLANEAHEALVRESEASPTFRARCQEASGRSLAMRRRVPPAPVAALGSVFEAAAPLGAELARRLAQADHADRAEVET